LKRRFRVPPSIEANGYGWGKIAVRIDYELTQAREKLKKIVSPFPNHAYHRGLTKIDWFKKDMSIGDAQSRQTIYAA